MQVKEIFILLIVIYLSPPSSCQNLINNGQYTPDNSGAYNGDDGRYHPDESGRYVSDNSGRYTGSFEKYIHQADVFGKSGSDPEKYINDFDKYKSQNEKFGGIGGAKKNSIGGGTISNINTKVYSTSTSIPITSSQNIYKKGSVAGLYDNKNYVILKKVEEVDLDDYHYLYETENGIYAQEDGKLDNAGSENEVMKAKGYFTYTGPDNIVYTVEYTADENGFVPQGVHLPTPPPIPEAILRSLE